MEPPVGVRQAVAPRVPQALMAAVVAVVLASACAGGPATAPDPAAIRDAALSETASEGRESSSPAWWGSWWYRGFGAVLVAGLVYGGYRWRVRAVERRSQALALEVSERTLELAQQTADLEALYQADEELGRRVELEDVLQTLVDIAVDVLGADKSALLWCDEQSGRLTVRVARNFSPAAIERLVYDTREGAAGHSLLHAGPTAIADLAQDRLHADGCPEVAEVLHGEGIASMLCLPIRLESGTCGILNVGYTHPHAFDERDQRLLTALAHRATIAIGSARHFAAEQHLAEQFRLLNEVSRKIAPILDVGPLLKEIAQELSQSFGYAVNCICLVQEDELIIKAAHPPLEEPPPRLTMGGSGIMSLVAATGQPMSVADVSAEPRYVRWSAACDSRSELAVPLVTKSGTIGVLNVESDHLNAFSENDVVVLQALANQAAIALENALLYQQAQETAASQERSRLARELHDAVTQTLFSASLIAEALPALWESDQATGQQLLQDLRQMTRGALAEMRTLLLELRPGALAEARLTDLLRQLAESVAGQTGTPVEVRVEGCPLPDLPDDVHVGLYRIAQEALNNIVKHAQASRVEVLLRCTQVWSCGQDAPGYDRVRVELSIADDGRGFDPAAVGPDHLGLQIIRERAGAIGAALTIDSQPGRGTSVLVAWE